MCVSMSLKTEDFYFGRNMDIGCGFGEHIVITPRNYPISFRQAGNMDHHFAIMGMATVIENYPLYADGVNEKGLCMAGLNFPENAYYSKIQDSQKKNISPFEIILWVLGQCETVEQAKQLLEETCLVDIPFNASTPVASLHWHIADKKQSIVLECTKSGMHCYENPVHVLTNNPTFDFHMTNLAQYLNIRTDTPKNIFSEKIGITEFAKGMGSIGLPGDFSSTSRFVKLAYLRLNSACQKDENSSISQFFHLLDSVAVVNGSIQLDDGQEYTTTYSCCINADKGIYYYKTYFNHQLTAIHMNHENLDQKELIRISLIQQQQILQAN